MRGQTLATAGLVTALAVGLTGLQACGGDIAETAPETVEAGMPVFEPDTSFPPDLPNDWVMGQVPGIAVDAQDHVWVLHRPRTVPADLRDRAAPAVLEFDADGAFVNAWGGPGDGYDWPDSEHGIFVDYRGNVWVGGSSPTSQSLTDRSDDMLLKFTRDGEFLLQIGGPDQSGGNADTMSVQRSADAFVYEPRNELFVADGYGNRRVIVFDADTGAFKRMWGAFGNVPEDASAPGGRRGGGPPAGGRGQGRGTPPPLETEGPGPQQFGGAVHGVKVSHDGMVYVADRPNRRIQVFDLEGQYITQTFLNRAGPSGNSAAGLAFSPDEAQRFLYVVDYGNSRVAVFDRASLTELYQFGRQSDQPGDFRGPHHLAVSSRGDLYVVEVDPGNRVQRLAYTVMSSAPPANALPMEPPANSPE